MAPGTIIGGCPSDYAAVGIAIASLSTLCVRAFCHFLFLKGKRRTRGFWIVAVQIFGSFCLILGLMMSFNYFKFKRRHSWQSCYIWAVWISGTLGFGLLFSFRIDQAYQLYFLFVRRRLPSIRSVIFTPLVLLPWMAGAAVITVAKPLDVSCHVDPQWIAPTAFLLVLYIAPLVWLTYSIRHIKFRFHEFRDLLRGVIISAIFTGLWIIAYVIFDVHEDNDWIQATSRFFLLFTVSILVWVLFSVPIFQPLLSQMSQKKRGSEDYITMSEALGIREEIPDQETLRSMDFNEPLEKLLMDTNFRKSFMSFADSCLAGESVHFYEEVLELNKISVDDPERRIYMATHIIERYIIPGSEMEVNISYWAREEILSTVDLASPCLFDRVTVELLHLVKTNLVKDYWSSLFFERLKGESSGERIR